jgi:histidine ammonia-lyase
VQDPYCVRCVAAVHGACRDALDHAAEAVLREINSVTDNPVLFGDEVVSGGNFHGEPVALPLDYLAIALTEWAGISERRTYLLLSGHDGLPPMLIRDGGLNSGLMITQYTAAALVSECKVLSHPASVDSIPTGGGQEDHVSMGATAAVKCYDVLDRVESVLAIEILCAGQALDFRAPLTPGPQVRAAHAALRRVVSHADADRAFGLDIQQAHLLTRGRALLDEVERAGAALQ